MDGRQARYDHATRDLEPPFGIVDVEAFAANAADLVRRARGKPIRIATKSLRCRALLADTLARDGFRGALAYSLPEAIWLAESGLDDDIVVAYPTANRAAISELAAVPDLAARITLMVDSVEQLDLIDATAAPARRATIRVCLDLDASLRLAGHRLHLGTRRSPIHAASDAASLASRIAGRPGFTLVGLMAYEGQIAGVGDAPPGLPLRGLAIRRMQRWSAAELADRRAAAVAAISAVVPLAFVNGGGTGSLHGTSAEAAVTEVAAGSGLYGPALFDHYRSFRPRPAALFALAVVRRPGPGMVTVEGGGWVASGASGRDRLPVPTLPPGLRLTSLEGAGEVQTPVVGRHADRLRVGDRVWFRHAKAGELSEHLEAFHLVEGDRIVRTVPTYRGEGRTFL